MTRWRDVQAGHVYELVECSEVDPRDIGAILLALDVERQGDLQRVKWFWIFGGDEDCENRVNLGGWLITEYGVFGGVRLS